MAPPGKEYHGPTQFLKTTGTVIAGATLARDAFAGNAQQSGDSAAGGRLILPINRNWRYNRKFVEGAHEANSTIRRLNASRFPHQHQAALHSFDDKDYEFVSIYRRRFKLRQRRAGGTCLWTLKA